MKAINHTRTYMAFAFLALLFTMIAIGYLNLLPH